ncbi:DUF4389 domain-containing protein [Methylomonas paludis]|uniref:DUF4389 domain-containing protein n=1 Tax=Methylomonas paludis TaxID=1173101 RepID=A0A975MN82_9GAMM|nr:DUF4389 domain-containing protein [Methylomonas paludis]QWF70973.1 DUF4389 domain-containing protein [Methylomonas paludis]
MSEQINENLKKIETWKRIIFMLIYAVIDSLVKLLLWLVIFLQAGSVLLTGITNPNLLEFGRSLSSYHYHILLFLTFSTEKLPFPFAEWNLSANPALFKDS